MDLKALKGKKGAVFLIGGAVAIGGFLWYRHKQATASTSTAGTTDPNAIDPNTGIPYSQEQGGGIDPNTGLPYGQGVWTGGGVPGGGPGPVGPPGPPGPPGGGGPTPPHTNAEWAQQAEDHLHGGAFVAAALHKYIAGGAMNPDPAQGANAANRVLGYPPERGA